MTQSDERCRYFNSLVRETCALGGSGTHGMKELLAYAKAVDMPVDFDDLLCCACESGNLDLVQLLVTHGANINFLTRFGSTPLLLACYCAKGPQVPMFLVQMGAEINAQDEDDRTPLMVATVNGDYGTAEFLIKSGADLSLSDDEGRTARDYITDMADKHKIWHNLL